MDVQQDPTKFVWQGAKEFGAAFATKDKPDGKP